MTDAELLARFVRSTDQAAFAEVVRRHAGMVLGTARRLAPQDADDVAQAAFWLLAQRASRLLRTTDVGGWLYQTTRRCAANARRGRARETRRIAAAAAMDARQASQRDGGDLAAILDDGLSRLPSSLRDVILLRHVESLSVAETAERLGVAATTVTKRSERGLSWLRDFFAARGVASASTATIVATLATPTANVDAATLAAAATGKATPAVSALATTSAVPAALAVAAAIALVAAGAMAVGVGGRASTAVAATRPAALPATTPAATRPTDASTRESATAAAEAFLSAMRARDAGAVAALLGGDPSDAAARAGRLLADVRDGAYARFPQRLAMAGSGGSYSVAPTRFDANGNRLSAPADPNEIVGATFEARTPTEAEIGRLVFDLSVVDGTWKVAAAQFVADGATTIGARDELAGSPAAATRPVPADAARAASAAWARAERAMRGSLDVGSLEESKLPAFRAGLVEFGAAVRDFARPLDGTSLAVPAADVERVAAMASGLIEAIDREPYAAVKARLAGMETDAALGASMARFVDASRRLSRAMDASGESDAPTPRVVAFGPPATLTLAWTGERVRLRGPLAVPPWLSATQAWKRWEFARDIRTFRTRDDAGNWYEVEVFGASRDPDGTTRPSLRAVRQYRPDGTLAAVARYLFGGRAYEWGEFDATGTRYTYRVSGRASNPKDPDGISEVKFFSADGDIRYWYTSHDAENRVWWERVQNPIGEQEQTIHLVRNNGTDDGKPEDDLPIDGLPIERE